MEAAGPQDGRPATPFQEYLSRKRNVTPGTQQPSLSLVQANQQAGVQPLTGGLVPQPQQQLQRHGTSNVGLQEAASGLARAARSLAQRRGAQSHAGSSGAPDPAAACVQASFAALATAAQQLAMSVAAQHSSTGGAGRPRQSAPRGAPAAVPPALTTQGVQMAAGSQVHRPTTAARARPAGPAAAPAASAPAAPADPAASAAQPAQPAGMGLPAPFCTPSPQPVVPAGRTSTPSFTPLNPLLALAMQATSSQRQRPGSTASSHAACGASGRCSSWPATANPITHSLQEPQRPASACTWGSAAAGGAQLAAGNSSRPGSRHHGLQPAPGPGSQGSQVAQVLTLPSHQLHGPQGEPRTTTTAPAAAATAAATGSGQCASGPAVGVVDAGLDMQAAPDAAAAEVLRPRPGGPRCGSGLPPDTHLDPVAMFLDFPELMRMEHWPPRSPVTVQDLQDDGTSRAMNGLLAALRDRICTHGAGAIERNFRLADGDGSGELDAAEFRGVLERSLNLVGGLRDPNSAHVLDLLMRGLDHNHDGRINWVEFVNAVKFNQLPYRLYNRRFRHRVGGNPEEPFGPPGMSFPYGTMTDAESNNQAVQRQIHDRFQALLAAFRDVDADTDGVVSRREFGAALRRIDAQHRLSLGEGYIQQLFRDADPDFSGGVDYTRFVNAFHSGAPGSRFVPEFLLPQSLRCSQLGPPWEWHTAPVPGGRRAGAVAPPMSATRNISAGLGPATSTLKATSGSSAGPADAPPATPLAGPGTRLLRTLQ